MEETRWFLVRGFPSSWLAVCFLANFFEDEENLCIFTNITFDYIIVVLRKFRIEDDHFESIAFYR